MQTSIESLQFVVGNLGFNGDAAVERIPLVAGLAVPAGAPIGIAIARSRRVADVVPSVASIVITIPSISPCHHIEDHPEAVSAPLEPREPTFTGR